MGLVIGRYRYLGTYLLNFMPISSFSGMTGSMHNKMVGPRASGSGKKKEWMGHSPLIELVLLLAGLAGGLDVHEGDGDGGADLSPPRQAPHTLHRSISETREIALGRYLSLYIWQIQDQIYFLTLVLIYLLFFHCFGSACAQNGSRLKR